MKTDTFISYATEDTEFVSDVAHGLKSNGIKVWYAPLSLEVGGNLLDSINEGLKGARTGILILSHSYFAKKWTLYEKDILLRQHIVKSKKVFPIWHKISKADVENWNEGLAGIVAITQTNSVNKTIDKLVSVLSDGAPSRGVIPSWENPAYRFLSGYGEINLNGIDGVTTTIFEFLVHSKGTEYPLWLAGNLYSKIDLLLKIAPVLIHDPNRVKNLVGEEGYKILLDLCVEEKINLNLY